MLLYRVYVSFSPLVPFAIGLLLQCGGLEWTGSTCCMEGYECVAVAECYSQVRPRYEGSPTAKSWHPSRRAITRSKPVTLSGILREVEGDNILARGVTLEPYLFLLHAC